MKRLIFAVLLVLAIVSVASADKSVTLKTIVLADVSDLQISRQGTGWVVFARYTIHDASNGNQKQSGVSVALSAGQQTTIESFITANILPAANTQEGL